MHTSKSIVRLSVTICILLTLLIPTIIDTEVRNYFSSPQNNEGETQSIIESLVDNNALKNYGASDIDFDTMEYAVVDTSDSFESYTLCVLYQRDRSTYVYTNSLIVMAPNGTIISSMDVGPGGNWFCSAEFITPDTVLLGTYSGAALWHFNNDTIEYLGFIGHHEYEYNPNTQTVFTFEYYWTQIEDIPYRFDYIREYNMSGSLIWSMDTHDILSTDWWCPYEDIVGDGYRDLSHSNTIFYDSEDDVIYYNSRNTNTFFKINHSSSEVIWGLGEYGNFTLYDMHGNLSDELFYHAHAVEKVNENTFILFDNDYHNQTDPESKISRILEIVIDEETMIANESWYYSFPREYYSWAMGDADRLPNGNRIGASGLIDPNDGILSAAFVEVNEEGGVVWEADFYYNPTYIYGAYRLERFTYQPTINPVPDIEQASTPQVINWDVFYNYRNKEKMPGEYFLYVDDVEVDSGIFSYERFWQPTTLSLSPGALSSGSHNVTLEVTDGYGHSQYDYVNVTIVNFFLERSGSNIIEKGQLTNLPTWSGSTLSPLSYNITLNGTLLTSSTWTGDDIVLDPDLIDVGLHNTTLRMFNGTKELYSDTFWLQVTPAEPPVILPLQSTTLSINWNDTLLLSWNLTDVTGGSWNIYLNGFLYSTGTWSPTNVHVEMDIPVLDDGLYNITLLAIDAIGQESSSVCWLTILPPPLPVITSSPGDQLLVWGEEDVSLTWGIYQGTSWVLEKNGAIYRSGTVSGDNMTFDDINWIEENWRIGDHNLTLILFRDEIFTSDTITVTITMDLGDPFADAYLGVYSESYLYGSNAIGAPDGLYTTIFIDYSNGYITLDMGVHEEILDGAGTDFSVVAMGDNYSVYVSDSLETSFIYLGGGSGVKSFDISTVGLEQARYVRVLIYSGEEVNLDAIVANYYNVPIGDDKPPVIQSINDLSMVLGDISILNWTASDSTPSQYAILVNSVEVESYSWNGSFIVYAFEPDSIGLWNVTLVLQDGFGNLAYDTVMIDVVAAPETDLMMIPLLAGIGIAALVIVVIVLKFKRDSLSKG